MQERHVVLGVTGSIAAYKAVDLASKLTQAGVSVHVVMTESAAKLVGPASFRAITGLPVSTDLFALTNPFAIEHISLADVANAFLIAPATANVIAKVANGIADDLLSCTALAIRAPLLIAPAMHTAMWESPATQENVNTLRSRGAMLIGPDEGRLASGGYGAGRFAPVNQILGETLRALGRSGDLAGRTIVVTAGGTREPIDDVRFIGNRSSGRMGVAIAEAARDRGSRVVLLAASMELEPPAGVEVQRVFSAAEMHAAVKHAVQGADVLVMSAAVADYQPESVVAGKRKKTDDAWMLNLCRTKDILASVDGPPLRVGFAAESDDLVENARRKLADKSLDLIVANRIGSPDGAFGSLSNQVTLLDRDGGIDAWPMLPKREVADRLLDRVVKHLVDQRGETA